ncbi:type VII secretion protein EccE [Amycolatopsis sp. cmx-4-83]|uniref:type VII secretion protein EccE n=1 Tax=Amycolatopsis sp. cmx-4-83 TaxID=2790940 RepID=UPI003978F640
MTDSGAARANGYRGAPAPPPAHPAATRPAAFGAAAGADAASRAAAREAALAALSAARQPSSPARVPAPVAPPSPPRTPPPAHHRPTGRPRALGAARIVCGQVVLVALVLAATRPWPVLVAVAIPAAVVVALTTVRVHGRWLSAWLVVGSDYLLRNRTRDLRGPAEAGRELLRLLSPEATGTTGDTGFLLSRAAGITVVLQPKTAGRDPAMPSPETLLPPPHEQTEAVAAQVVHHAGIPRDRPPRVWLALQALRTVDVQHDTDVQRALGNAVRRVQRRLRRDGLPAHGLTEPELLGTLASLAHVNAGRGQVREDWRYWHSGKIAQATFRLGGWAELPPGVAPQLLRWLPAKLPRAAVTVAVTAHRPTATAPTRTEATLRLAAASTAELDHAAAELTRLAGEWALSVDRLDGRHAQGVAATVPIGLAGP